MYFASGEMATSAALPVSVTLVMEIFSNGRCRLRLNNAKTPYAAAATSAKVIKVTKPVPNLCWRAAATTVEPLDAGRDGATACSAMSWDGPDALDVTLRPDSVSRFNLLRSPRKSAADW